MASSNFLHLQEIILRKATLKIRGEQNIEHGAVDFAKFPKSHQTISGLKPLLVFQITEKVLFSSPNGAHASVLFVLSNSHTTGQ